MNTKNIIAAVAVLAATAAGSAFADQTYPSADFNGHQGTATRAEVVANLQQARADGDYVVGGTEITSADAGFVSTKTRAQVLAELQQAQQNGTYVAGGEAYPNQFPATAAAQTELASR